MPQCNVRMWIRLLMAAFLLLATTGQVVPHDHEDHDESHHSEFHHSCPHCSLAKVQALEPPPAGLAFSLLIEETPVAAPHFVRSQPERSPFASRAPPRA